MTEYRYSKWSDGNTRFKSKRTKTIKSKQEQCIDKYETEKNMINILSKKQKISDEQNNRSNEREQDIEKKRKLSSNQKILSQKSEIVKYEPKSSFSFGKLLSYILVIIISFIALILILDTFKIQLYNIFPRLEIFLFNLYETLKDIQLFIKDLI